MAWPLPRQGKKYHLTTLGLESIPINLYGRVPRRVMERILNEESTTLRQGHVLPEKSGTVCWVRSYADNLTTG